MPLSSETGIEAGLQRRSHANFLQWLKHNQNTLFTALTGSFIVLSFISPVKKALGFDPALIGAIIGGYPMLKFAGIGLFVRKDITAGVLVSVALIASVAIGEYFAAAEVAFIMLLGELLENATIARAGRAVEKLVALVPTTARLRTDDGEIEIPASELKLGKIVVVRAGELIPADGKIVAGTASVNQAALTGEPMPCDKTVGEEVLAGTINEAGYMEIEVLKGARDTTVAQIGRLVAEAQLKRAPVQRLADKWARYLVPASMTAALLTWLITGEVVRGVTILIVFCPCALVLATPTAVAAAIGRAAKRGILIKSGAALEAAGRVDTLAFDKTGTLTAGRPEVTAVVAFDTPESEVLQTAVTIEQYSNHPLARAVVRAYGEESGLPSASGFENKLGLGVSGWIGADQVVVGKAGLLVETGIAVPDSLIDQVTAARHAGQTAVYVARGKRCLGALLIGDTVRPDSGAAANDLLHLGTQLAMMTGDDVKTAQEVAAMCNIGEVYAGLLPAEKAGIVASLQAEGRKVAMVGDGINDAPALATADLGIAMGSVATDIAAEAGDITILSDNMAKVVETVHLGRHTLGVIRQNLIISAIINTLAVAAAAAGIMGPVVAALVHNAGSVLVVLNAARLIGRKKAA